MTRPQSFSAGAPSKLILFGEHAVVYGHAAVAVPLAEPCALATAGLTQAGVPVTVALEDFKLTWSRGEEPAASELRPFARLVESLVKTGRVPDNGWALAVRSAVPIGCGLGSGAAVAAASLRAVYGLFGVSRSDADLSADVYEVERLLHGSPSGVDNTVIAHGRPVLFKKGSPPKFLPAPARALRLAVADTGWRHKTAEVVSDVAQRRREAPGLCDGIFEEIGSLAAEGARAFESGDHRRLGVLMDENQGLLVRLGVSSGSLDHLVGAARAAGALGAKLCGAGKGGCMAALAESGEHALRVARALEEEGAKRVFVARVGVAEGMACRERKD
ncbi:MAG: mevalonate kinase [Elusimicrobia bacterium]|nr:mevalonate kinase [Elusimicrobiota bacterium]